MTTVFLAGFCLGIAALWAFLELISLAARRRAPPLTLRGRKSLDRPEPTFCDVGVEAAYPRGVNDGGEQE